MLGNLLWAHMTVRYRYCEYEQLSQKKCSYRTLHSKACDIRSHQILSYANGWLTSLSIRTDGGELSLVKKT